MIDKNRLETAPTEHVRNIFKSIRDGEITVTYYDPIEPPYSHTYKVSCSYADLDKFLVQYTELIQALDVIGKVLRKSSNSDKIKDFLAPDQYAVWKTYVRDFDEKFNADNYDLEELYERRNCGDDLSDDEHEMLDKHYEWLEQQCLQRLPYKGTSVVKLINTARKYVYLTVKNAPKVTLDEEARCLAEELIIYNYFVSD